VRSCRADQSSLKKVKFFAAVHLTFDRIGGSSNGIESLGTCQYPCLDVSSPGRAVYRYRTALKYGDKEAAEAALTELGEYGSILSDDE